MSQETFRPSEAERYLKLGKNSIYSLLRKGAIPSEQVEGRYVIQLADLDAYRAQREGATETEKKSKGKKKVKAKQAANRTASAPRKEKQLPETPHAFAGMDELIGAFRTLSENGFTHVGRSPDKASPTADILAAYETLREHGLAT